MEPPVIEADQREPWRRDGCLLEGLLPADEVATARQDHAEGAPWHGSVRRATLRQLVALGFPEPGHHDGTEEMLRGVEAGYPSLDMTPWREAAAGVSGR
ncbi:MAG TPA: hypothetical protein VG032_09820 [Acidimicrobiales bacterium]|jgi:hypothetical protein|nr:hypothetical protein [Acidimicrobiales bacterium]